MIKGAIAIKIREKLTRALSLPKEIALDLPLIVATGRGELNIENYKSLLAFSEEKIRVRTSAGELEICGVRLHLKQMTTENLLITGEIGEMNWSGS